MNWDDLQSFLAIAREGSLSGAAKKLGVTQPTMGRRLEKLQGGNEAAYLQRTPSGFLLTEKGQAILPHIEEMEAQALAVERTLSGSDHTLTGEVRLATVEAFASHILIPALPMLHEKHPEISLEIDVDTRSFSLARREADIAVRMAEFTEHSIIVRKAAQLAFGVYASTDYISRYGIPKWKSDRKMHRYIALQPTLMEAPEAKWFAKLTGNAKSVLSSNSRDGQLAAALAGSGIACLPRYLGDSMKELQLLSVPTNPPERIIWIGIHEDTKNSPRFRAVLNWLYQIIDTQREKLSPSH